MGCLYCGKEIGAFRLLRDSEFCSAPHRKKYGERLGKALHEIAAPEPAPAPVAGFCMQMPFHPGNIIPKLNLWQGVEGRIGIRTITGWPLTIDKRDDTTSEAVSGTASEAASIPGPAPVECPPPQSERWMQEPQADPVAAMVRATAALAPARALRLPRLAAELKLMTRLDQARFEPLPRPEPVTAFVQAAAVLTPSRRVAANPSKTVVALPKFTGELESLDVPDQSCEPPAICQRWMPVPAAEPVSSYVHASAAPAVAVPVTLRMPAAEWSMDGPQVPLVARLQRVSQAEPVTSAVRSGMANLPAPGIGREARMALPAIPRVQREPFAVARPAPGQAPDAVESLLIAAQATVPVGVERAPRVSVELAAPPAVVEPVPAMAKAMAGPAPDAVESLLTPSVVAAIACAATLRMPPFVMAAGKEHTVPGLEAQRLEPRACEPSAAAPRLVAPQPISTVAVTPPARASLVIDSALPHPGLLPLEFHTSRVGSAPASRPEWIWPRPGLQPPKFLLGQVPEKLEEPAQPKTARKEPVEILKRPAATRQPSVLMVAGRVAAGFLLVASLWYGVANFRVERRTVASEEIPSVDGATLSAGSNASPARVANGGTLAQPAPKGAIAWVRRTIADRAAVKISENFHNLENWDSGAKGDLAGWARHPDGYTHTGALALYRPTLKFEDYRVEFFGQIEAKSIGWTVRAADTRNYHAMKLTVVEEGLRPFVALVQYNVADGKSGHRTQTPLNVMVHHNRPMQLTVDVRGNRFVTSIDGEEVDSFIDNTRRAGGVGFFSEAGERARLYWMNVSRNDDWLGHVCAMLSDGSSSTAAVRRPELPGGGQTPGLPGDRDGMTLAAAWIGLPYLRGPRKPRLCKTWSEPWNT